MSTSTSRRADRVVLDLKPYIPVADRLEKVEVPEWYEGWPDYMPDEGFGLYED